MNMANEGLEAKKKDDEVAHRKRKAEEDKTWEGTLLSSIHTLPLPTFYTSVLYFTETREQRVDSWRSFSNTSKKKKKTKTAFLG
jgi:DnaJ homolog subfamily C member 8